jgi:hypothetical protein
MFILKLLLIFWAFQIILILAFMRGARGPIGLVHDEELIQTTSLEGTAYH